MNNRSSTPRLGQVVRHPSLPGLGAVIRLVDSSALAVIQSSETTPEADIFPVALADAADQSLRLDLWDTRRVDMRQCTPAGELAAGDLNRLLRAMGKLRARGHYEAFHTARPFVPDTSSVPVSGKRYGAQEMENLIEASSTSGSPPPAASTTTSRLGWPLGLAAASASPPTRVPPPISWLLRRCARPSWASGASNPAMKSSPRPQAFPQLWRPWFSTAWCPSFSTQTPPPETSARSKSPGCNRQNAAHLPGPYPGQHL